MHSLMPDSELETDCDPGNRCTHDADALNDADSLAEIEALTDADLSLKLTVILRQRYLLMQTQNLTLIVI